MATTKLVRARPKAVEYLPDDFKCCDRLIELMRNSGEFVVDISTAHIGPEGECYFCGAKSPPRKIVRATDNGTWAELDAIDLDEGVSV